MHNFISFHLFLRYDSLTGVPSSQRALAFEKGSVLFNIGALYTQIGARQDRSATAGIDRAIDAFQRAAGTEPANTYMWILQQLQITCLLDKTIRMVHTYKNNTMYKLNHIMLDKYPYYILHMNHFLLCLGAFNYLKENFSNAPSLDMSGPSLCMLVRLMVAQVQECVFERVTLTTQDTSFTSQLCLAQEAARVSARLQLSCCFATDVLWFWLCMCLL